MSNTQLVKGFRNTLLSCLWAACMLFVFAANSFAQTTNLTLSAEEKSFINEHPTIVLGTDQSWEPYVIVLPDGKMSGYDAEILEQINQRTGANFTLAVGKWSEMQSKAKAHEIDGLSTGTAAT